MQEALIDDDVLDEAQLMNTVEGDRTLGRELAGLFLLAELRARLTALQASA